jgi:hypothetical protein
MENPKQYLSRYTLPRIKYVSPRESNYPDSAYTLGVTIEDGYVYIDRSYELPIYGFDDIIYKENLDYYICRERFITVSDTEVKYIPTYEEKEAAYTAGAITRAQLINDNYYYYKKGESITTFKYGILNKYGYPIITTQFDELLDIKDNYYITKINNKYGLMQLNSGNLKSKKIEIYKNVFDSMSYMGNGLLLVKQNGISFIVDFYGNIFEPKK